MQLRSLIPLALGAALITGCASNPSQGGADGAANTNVRVSAGGIRLRLAPPATPPRSAYGRVAQPMGQRVPPDPAAAAEAERRRVEAQEAARQRREAEEAELRAARPADAATARRVAGWIAQDSRGWATNRLDAGSVTNVVILPTRVGGAVVARADYTFNGGQRGWGETRIANGNFQCIRFWDFADECRALRQPSQEPAQNTTADLRAGCQREARRLESYHDMNRRNLESDAAFSELRRYLNPTEIAERARLRLLADQEFARNRARSENLLRECRSLGLI